MKINVNYQPTTLEAGTIALGETTQVSEWIDENNRSYFPLGVCND